MAGKFGTFTTNPKALNDVESLTKKVPGGAYFSKFEASSREMVGLYQYLDESLANLEFKKLC